MSSDEARAFLTGGGAPSISWKFAQPKEKVVGIILAYDLAQQRDFVTKELKAWDDGSPMMQAIVTLAVEELTITGNDPVIEGPNDDGQRRLFVKGGMQAAVRAAIQQAAHRGDLLGGRLGVVFTGLGEATRAGLNPPKLYNAKFEPNVMEVPVPAPASSSRVEADGPPVESYEEFGEEPF